MEVSPPSNSQRRTNGTKLIHSNGLHKRSSGVVVVENACFQCSINKNVVSRAWLKRFFGLAVLASLAVCMMNVRYFVESAMEESSVSSNSNLTPLTVGAAARMIGTDFFDRDDATSGVGPYAKGRTKLQEQLRQQLGNSATAGVTASNKRFQHDNYDRSDDMYEVSTPKTKKERERRKQLAEEVADELAEKDSNEYVEGANLEKSDVLQEKLQTMLSGTEGHIKNMGGKPLGEKLKLNSRVLVGIISSDSNNDRSYRRRHRHLFELWNDTRTCSLSEYTSGAADPECALIYTFVIGGNLDPNAPTEILNDTIPILATKPIKAKHNDVNDPDTSLLNIRENMNDGKSQTFLYFASQVMEQYDIHYVMKCDADSILHLHDFFAFAHRNLPPPPFNTNIFVGALRDKAYWPKLHNEKELIRFESFFGNEFEGVHLYLAGQLYMMSSDLAAFTADEATRSYPYQEHHEDHDISAMALHSPTPIHMVTIGKSQRFWEHPVKGEPRWKRIWKRETCRMSGLPFEGKTMFIH